jgi:hypothetical protein
VPLLAQVQQPPGGAHHDLNAGLEGGHLGLVGPAAVDGHDPHAAAPPGELQVAGDLHAQFPGRHDDQRLRSTGRGQVEEVVVAGGDQALQDRDAEGQRLAGTGAGLADDVGAGERDRQGEFLDREGLGDADLVESVGDGADDA